MRLRKKDFTAMLIYWGHTNGSLADILAQFAPTAVCTHYHAVYSQPYWKDYMTMVTMIGDHKFYAE